MKCRDTAVPCPYRELMLKAELDRYPILAVLQPCDRAVARFHRAVARFHRAVARFHRAVPSTLHKTKTAVHRDESPLILVMQTQTGLLDAD